MRLFVGDGSGWRFDDTGPVLSAGSTYHLVATYDGTNARLYVNGVLVSTGPNVTMAPTAANVMRFGAFSTGPGQYWPGVLDEASFYPLRPQLQSGSGALQRQRQRQSGDLGCDRSRYDRSYRSSSEHVGAGGVGGGAGGTDADCVDGELVGDEPDLLCVSVAAVQPRLRRDRRCDGEHLRGRGGRSRREPAGCASPAATRPAPAQAASAQTAAVIAAGQTTVTFSVTAGGDDGDVSVSGPQSGGYPPSRQRGRQHDRHPCFTAGRRLAFGNYPGADGAASLRHLLPAGRRHCHRGQAARAT